VNPTTAKTRLRLLVPVFFSASWLVFAVFWCSDVVVDFGVSVSILCFAGIWLGVYLLRLGIFAWRESRKHFADSDSPLGFTYWSIEPVAFVLVFLLIQFGALSAIRFRLSEKALTDFAAEVRAGRVASGGKTNQLVGMYRIREIHLDPDGVVKFLLGQQLFAEYGIAHSPAGRPANKGRDSYRWFRQPWWQWEREPAGIDVLRNLLRGSVGASKASSGSSHAFRPRDAAGSEPRYSSTNDLRSLPR
jgi:hypothetical protein